MKKNSRGFFLAETIIVLAVVTTAIAFVLPNVTKVYENYKNTSKYYDQTKDIYALKAIAGILENEINDRTKKGTILGCKKFSEEANQKKILTGLLTSIDADDTLNLTGLYIADYLGNPTDSEYNFKKYLSRLKKTSYDKNSYRLIGIFEEAGVTRYASIKYQNPGTDKCTP